MLQSSQSTLPQLVPQSLPVPQLHPRRLFWTVPHFGAPTASPRLSLRRFRLHLLVLGSVPYPVISHAYWPPSGLMLDRVFPLLPLRLSRSSLRLRPQLPLLILLLSLLRAAVVALASLFARCLLGRWLCPLVC